MGDLSCERFAELLGDYVDGVLKPLDVEAVEAHRLACPPCAELLADYERIPALVRRATNLSMPSGAKARLRRLLAHGWRRRS